MRFVEKKNPIPYQYYTKAVHLKLPKDNQNYWYKVLRFPNPEACLNFAKMSIAQLH